MSWKELPKEERLRRLRHSAAHVMAQVVQEMFPEGSLAIGPPIDTGFYYDFDLPRPLTPEDLTRIEERMREVIAAGYPFQRRELSEEEARKLFARQPYKRELIDGISGGGSDEYGERPAAPPVLSTYRHGGFEDLCQGPHVDHTGEIPSRAFKLMSVAGAYWRGDEKRPMLQRVYGALFESEEELTEYLTQLAEAERRDHRRLGRELNLFSTHEEYGPGLIYWHPKGGRIRTIIEDFWRQEHYRSGYEIVYTPHLGKAALWETSGHLDFYAENMYSPLDVDGQHYYVKPMNCPFHIQIYKSAVRSYRDLPLRLAELGTVYRYERSGVLHGLLRVRGFTQDDAHLFVRPDQVAEEMRRTVQLTLHIFRAFGFREFPVYLATRPEKFVGSPAEWEMAEGVLRRVIEDEGLPYDVDQGGGVFYGPKIDIKVKDALGRPWQCTTVQFDFNLPERFDLEFVDQDGRRRRPYMVHRALLGSLERFFGVLIEHYGGAFPLWLAPVQAVVIPIADRHAGYARQVGERLQAAGFRVEVDDRPERMNAKIRQAQLQKTPYMLIVGDREQAAGALSVRLRTGAELGAIPLAELLLRMEDEVRSKALAP